MSDPDPGTSGTNRFEDTWDEIRSAFLVGFISMILLVTVYEIFRRVPHFSILFDKRRLYASERTPTRLMKSRYLPSDRKTCKLPSLFEFLFFNFDDNYIRYATAVNNEDDDEDEEKDHGGIVSELVYPSRWNGHFLQGALPIIRYFLLIISNKLSRSPRGKEKENKPKEEEKENTNLEKKNETPTGSLRMDEFTTLSSEDKKLLQCVGVDSFCMIRFLRFGFEITFLFFLLSLIILVPLYYLNEEPSSTLIVGDKKVSVAVKGYFQLTINHLDNGSNKLWVPWGSGICFYVYLLQRFYLEWNIFHQTRLDFLADGDYYTQKSDDLESLHQYRNSCLVENIPPEYRTNEGLRQFFEIMFPDQVVRAEMLLNTNKLTSIINQRQQKIIAYENIFAKHQDAFRRFHGTSKSHRCSVQTCSCLCCFKSKEPPTPQIRVGGFLCFGGDKKDALKYLESEILSLNIAADKELKSIHEKKNKSDQTRKADVLSVMDFVKNPLNAARRVKWDQFYTKIIPKELDFVGGHSKVDIMTENGFVEFKTRIAKQGALNCNLTGRSSYISPRTALDPRDIIWENVTVARSFIKKRRKLVSLGLSFGLIFWSALTGAIFGLENDTVKETFGPAVTGYLPVLIILIIMAILPAIFTFLAINVIRLKSMSEVDKFVFFWMSFFRIMNLLVIIFSNDFIGLANQATEEPDVVFKKLASEILQQSRYYLNLVFAVSGQSLFLQLSQVVSIGFQLFVRFMHTERYSQRFLSWIHEPKKFIYGRFGPEFIYIFMVALMYAVSVPLILGATSVYFFLATKVYTHQAVFVFFQPYEGGGKLMRLMNRTIFYVIYLSIFVFTIVLSIKEAFSQAISFLIICICWAAYTHRKIYEHFLKTSSSLPLVRARAFDEEYQAMLDRKESFSESAAAESSVCSISETGSIELCNSFQRSNTCRGIYLTKDEHGNIGRSMNLRADPLRGAIVLNQKAKRELIASDIQLSMGKGYSAFTADDDDLDEDGDDFFLFRQPHLYKSTWETKPQPYRAEK